ncbi:hypothetical protein AAW50_01200 [Mycoplasmopsis canis]|uniref:MSC_0623 family F1-like ATPase-associated protein n=1 Tax=Mycoplasmopsis canis TaxID=29555 RepID=UPI000624AC2C|nr:DUF2714 domain-containing protein [Mycoplasmopsis canis]AKF41053.1 hypothetical protein AAW50_01200 [Mycoplasmopsis canis]
MKKIFLFNRKKSVNEEQLFDLYSKYNEIVEKQSSKILSFETIMSKPLLNNNLGFNSSGFKEIKNRLEKAVEKREEIKFADFTITFNLNLKYSPVTMVPLLSQQEFYSDNYVNSFDRDEDYTMNRLMYDMNVEIRKLLEKGYYLEIIPNTVIFQDYDSLKLFFSKELTSKIA